MYTSVEVTVPVEAMMHAEPAWVTVSKTATVHSARLARRVNRKRDRQSGDCQEHYLLQTHKLVHGETSLSPLTP
jgi:hypothetical protein